jgi:N-acetyl-beta-hexosaminidase
MHRNNLLLPDCLKKYPKSTGVLATRLAVQEASRELEDVLRDWFEKDRIRRLKTYEAALRYVLD